MGLTIKPIVKKGTKSIKLGWHMSAYELYNKCQTCEGTLQLVNKKSASQDFICITCKKRFRLDLLTEQLVILKSNGAKLH